MNIKSNCYRLLFEEKRYLDQTRFDNYIHKKHFANYIRPKEKVPETLLGGLRCYYFFQSLRCGKTELNGQQIKIMQLVLQHVAKQVGRSVYVILSKNDDDNNNNNNNNNNNCENIDSLTSLFLVALGSDYSGAFRSEEDLRAMDDDIRKWYNVGNFFSKKIHLFSSFGTSFQRSQTAFPS